MIRCLAGWLGGRHHTPSCSPSFRRLATAFAGHGESIRLLQASLCYSKRVVKRFWSRRPSELIAW